MDKQDSSRNPKKKSSEAKPEGLKPKSVARIEKAEVEKQKKLMRA